MKNFLHKDSEVAEQIAKNGCMESSLGDIPNPTG